MNCVPRTCTRATTQRLPGHRRTVQPAGTHLRKLAVRILHAVALVNDDVLRTDDGVRRPLPQMLAGALSHLPLYPPQRIPFLHCVLVRRDNYVVLTTGDANIASRQAK